MHRAFRRAAAANRSHSPYFFRGNKAHNSSPQLRRQVATTAMKEGGKSVALDYASGPLVWVDCEMTGLDYRKDAILEIAVRVIVFFEHEIFHWLS